MIEAIGYNWNISVIAAFLSAIAIFINSFIAYKAFQFTAEKREESFHISWTNQVIDWAGACSDRLAWLQTYCDDNLKSDDNKLAEVLSELSSQIDKGRLLFENDKSDGFFGLDKPSAYQGYRPYILDCLVYSYSIVEFRNSSIGEAKDFGTPSDCQRIEEFRREFISEIQQIVNPAWFHVKALRFDKKV